MQRVLVYAHDDQPLFELSPLEVFALDRKEAVNGEHSLTIRTTRVLEKGQRILTLDNRGRWREHVVYGTDEAHESGQRPIGEYYCVWSLMHDLMGTTVSRMVGTQTPVVAEVALEAALSGTSRWVVGTVTNSNLGGASMYDMGGWEAMQVMTKTWGGEVDVTIEVGLAGVVSRKVDYYDAQGEHVAKRRFDFGADLKGVRRKIPDGPIFCRISPRGKGEETEGGGYGRKITIESVNDGKDWLQNDQLAPFVALPDGNGGWEYPKRIVENSQIETPAELKEWGLSVLEEYTVPKVSYEVDAVQVAIEGVDVQGVSLGDQVHVVDEKFGGLRLTARVVSVETDMLDELSVKVKLGYIGDNVGTMFTKLQGDIASVSAAVEAVRSGTEMTDTYLQRLVARLNEEINATGGYWYLIEGLGTRTYDTAVSDPTIGAEASKVIEMRGGSLRIADSKDAQGNWEWDTVFVSGHVAAQLITAAHLETGYIGSPTSGNYWNLDTGEFRMATNAVSVGDESLGDYVGNIVDNATEDMFTTDMLTQQAVFNALTNDGALQGLYMSNGQLYINGTYMKIGKISSANGTVYFDLNNNELACGKIVSPTTGVNRLNTIAEVLQASSDSSRYNGGLVVYNETYAGSDSYKGAITIIPRSKDGTSVFYMPCIRGKEGLRLVGSNGGIANQSDITITDESVKIRSSDSGVYQSSIELYGSGGSGSYYRRIFLYAANSVNVSNALIVNGTCTATKYNTSSDRRLKDHIDYIKDKAAAFIRSLKPALFKFKKDGQTRAGFYAQDVEEADPWGAFVGEQEVDGKTYKTLDYAGLVAPLVAYCQQLEERIDTIERRLDEKEAK